MDGMDQFYKLVYFLKNKEEFNIKISNFNEYAFGFNDDDTSVRLGFCNINRSSWKNLSGNIVVTNRSFYRNSSIHHFSWGGKHPIILPFPKNITQEQFLSKHIGFWGSEEGLSELENKSDLYFVEEYPRDYGLI